MNAWIETLYRDCSEGFIEGRAFAKGKPIARDWFGLNDIPQMYHWAAQNSGHDVFYGVATRKQGQGTKEAVIEIPAVWCDLDFKMTPRETARDLVKRFPFKPSSIISSGGGLHLYWRLREPAEHTEIPSVESVKRRIAHALGGDMASCDASRILRWVDSQNWKYNPAQPVELLQLENFTYSLDDFVDLPEPDVSPRSTEPDIQNRSLRLERIMKCRFMAHCREDAAALPEPEWYAMISILAGQQPGGIDLIHELSRPYPKYSKRETDSKILHALSSTGPMACQTIRGLWDCGIDCGVMSPAALTYVEVDKVDKVDNVDNVDKYDESRQKWTGSRQKVDKVDTRFNGNLAAEIKSYVSGIQGEFTTIDIDSELGIYTREDKKNRSKILSELINSKVIERRTGGRGVFRVKNRETRVLNWRNASTEASPLILPFQLHTMVKVMPKNIIVVAGSQNAGKTTFLLRCLHDNIKIYKSLKYYSSEMGDSELADRLATFPYPVEDWPEDDFEERAYDFHDKIGDNPDGLSFIDYLEIRDGEFYKIGTDLRNIFDSLKKGIAIVAIQKRSDSDIGRGGEITLEKPRLYLSISNLAHAPGHDICSIKIIKAKNYIGDNPNGKELHYRLIRGSDMEPITGWMYVSKPQREQYIRRYENMVNDTRQQKHWADAAYS